MKLKDTAFRNFYNEIKDKGLLFEVNNKLYLNTNYVNKGKTDFKKMEYTRLFIDTTRELYLNCTSRQHKQLSYVFQLLPFLHFETNIICSNPDEQCEDNLKKLCFTDICRLLNLSDEGKSVSVLKKDLLKLYITKDNKKYYVFTYVSLTTGGSKGDYFVINPYVVWKGKNLESMNKVVAYCLI